MSTLSPAGAPTPTPAAEAVWTLPRHLAEAHLGGAAPGLWTGALESFVALAESQGMFVERSLAETDESQLQLIPYVVIAQAGLILAVTRLNTQGESRLHGRWSVGIGGHLNPIDGTPPFWGGLRRELAEEVHLAPEDGILQPIGVILLGDSPVERVHCGAAWLLTLPAERPVAVRETEKMRESWETLESIQAGVERLENWSRVLLPWLAAHRSQLSP